MRIDMHHHFHHVADDPLLVILSKLKSQGAQIMATAGEVLALARATRSAVDKLEADVTAALAKLPSIPADVQADIDAAFAELSATVADAADGVDEASTPPA